jgi:hypothetical protein
MIDNIFEKYDKDKSGSLDEEEILSLMSDIFEKLGKSPKPTAK